MKKTTAYFSAFALLAIVARNGLSETLETSSLGASKLDRSVLPIKEPIYPAITELDARKATAPARFEVKAPDKAPNVVVVLIDDIGFGHSSAFGGPIHMPTLEKLAASGLKYNRFHTTALCSPTRTALLTGYNHHSNNAGAIMEVATAFPGNTGVRPQTITPVAEVLRLNGYSTAAFGNIMKHRHGKVRFPDHTTDGLPTRVLTSFTGLLEAKRINGTRWFMTAPHEYSPMSKIPAITLPAT